MNKTLATYLFGSETLFAIKSDLKHSSAIVEELSLKPQKDTNSVLNHDEQVKEKALELSTSADGLLGNVEAQTKKISKNTVIITNGFSESQKLMLQKILSSIKLELGSVHLIDINKELPQLNPLLDSTKSYKILSFGVAISKFNVQHLLFPYQPKSEGNIIYLIVDDLVTIEANHKDEKKLLWAALKNMFL